MSYTQLFGLTRIAPATNIVGFGYCSDIYTSPNSPYNSYLLIGCSNSANVYLYLYDTLISGANKWRLLLTINTLSKSLYVVFDKNFISNKYIAVGQYSYSGGAGAVQVFELTNNLSSYVEKILYTAAGTQELSNFGFCAGLDVANNILITSNRQRDNQANQASLYYSTVTNTNVQNYVFYKFGTDFNYSVIMAMSKNSNLFAVLAFKPNNNANMLYIFNDYPDRSAGSSLSPSYVINISSSPLYGGYMSINSSIIAIGLTDRFRGGVQTGNVLVYTYSGSSITALQTCINGISKVTNSNFGSTVQIVRYGGVDYLIIGSGSGGGLPIVNNSLGGIAVAGVPGTIYVINASTNQLIHTIPNPADGTAGMGFSAYMFSTDNTFEKNNIIALDNTYGQGEGGGGYNNLYQFKYVIVPGTPVIRSMSSSGTNIRWTNGIVTLPSNITYIGYNINSSLSSTWLVASSSPTIGFIPFTLVNGTAYTIYIFYVFSDSTVSNSATVSQTYTTPTYSTLDKQICLITTTAATVKYIQLPSIATAGYIIIIKDMNGRGDSSNIVIYGGSALIDGKANIFILNNYGSYILSSNGDGSWSILSYYDGSLLTGTLGSLTTLPATSVYAKTLSGNISVTLPAPDRSIRSIKLSGNGNLILSVDGGVKSIPVSGFVTYTFVSDSTNWYVGGYF